MTSTQTLARTLNFLLTDKYQVADRIENNHLFIKDTFGNTIDVILTEKNDEAAGKELEKKLEDNSTNGVYSLVIQQKPERKHVSEMKTFKDMDWSISRTLGQRFIETGRELKKIIERTSVDQLAESRVQEPTVLHQYDEKNTLSLYAVERVIEKEDRNTIIVESKKEKKERSKERRSIKEHYLARGDVQKIRRLNISYAEKSLEIDLVKGRYDLTVVLVEKGKSTYNVAMLEEGNKGIQRTFTFVDINKKFKSSTKNKQNNSFTKKEAEIIDTIKYTPEGFLIQPYNSTVSKYVRSENNARKKVNPNYDMSFKKAHAYHFAILAYVQKLDSIQAEEKQFSLVDFDKTVKIPDHVYYYEEETNNILQSRKEFDGSDADYLEYVQLAIEPDMMNYLKRAQQIQSGEIIPKKKDIFTILENTKSKLKPEQESAVNEREVDAYFARQAKKPFTDLFSNPQEDIKVGFNNKWPSSNQIKNFQKEFDDQQENTKATIEDLKQYDRELPPADFFNPANQDVENYYQNKYLPDLDKNHPSEDFFLPRPNKYNKV